MRIERLIEFLLKLMSRRGLEKEEAVGTESAKKISNRPSLRDQILPSFSNLSR
jgi:hypothetical protein